MQTATNKTSHHHNWVKCLFFFNWGTLLDGEVGDENERKKDSPPSIRRSVLRQRTRVGYGQRGHSKVLAASSAEADVVTVVVVHTALREHRVILDLRLAERRAVGRNNDQLG